MTPVRWLGTNRAVCVLAGMTLLLVSPRGYAQQFVLFDVTSGKLHVAKTPSTPRNQSEGILTGIAQLGVEPRYLQRIVHGTCAVALHSQHTWPR